MSSPTLDIRLLARFQVSIGGAAVDDFGYDKVRALLAFLAAEPYQHRRQVLAELLWPEQAETAARTNLRQALSKLRRALGQSADGLLHAGRERVSLSHGNTHCDAVAFERLMEGAAPEEAHERLEAAVNLYEGPFLQDLVISDSCEFGQWVETRRADLHTRALDILERLVELNRARRRFSAAMEWSHKLLELDPCHESGHRRLIELYATSGHRGAALRQFEFCRDRLREELNVDPEPETLALRDRILRGELTGSSGSTVVAGGGARRERRQITVVQCELHGLAGMDPEAFFDAIAVFQERSARIVTDLGGHLAWIGDASVTAYFGFPHAWEGATRSAVEAAQMIAEGVYEFQHLDGDSQRVFARVGVHTGTVVIRGSDDSPAVVGAVQSTAGDLCRWARPASVAVGNTTAELVAGYFETVPLAGNGEGFRVVRATGARTRVEANPHLLPLIGRRSELVALDEFVATCSGPGRPRSLLVRGEAGMGKTRLVHGFQERIEGVRLAVARCTPQYQDRPGHVVEELVRSLAGIPATLPIGQQTAALSAILQSDAGDSALHRLLGISASQGAAAPLDADGWNKAVLDDFAAMLGNLPERRPILLVVEDLHWMDPGSGRFIAGISERSLPVPLAWLLTGRPEVTADLCQGLSVLDLEPLSESQAELLARRAAGGAPPALLLAEIVRRCDGIPLFIEEMARLVSDVESERAAGLERIPATLHEVLMARIDRLGRAKPLLQIAACAGRTFSRALLEAVADADDNDLSATLAALVESGLVVPGDSSGVYEFKHALVQEAAYGSLLLGDRTGVHGRIARALQESFPEIAESEPAQVAHHLARSGSGLAAAPLWLKAGRQESLRSAPADALAHFTRGLKALRQTPGGTERDYWELELQLAAAAALGAAEGYGSARFREANSRALELCGSTRPGPEIFRVLWGLWLGASSSSDYPAARRLAEELARIADACGSMPLLAAAHYALGNNLFWLAEYETALSHQQAALQACGQCKAGELIALLGESPAVGALGFMGWTLWHLGEPDAALEKSAAAVQLARESGHPHILAFALVFAAQLGRFRQEPGRVRRYAEEALAIALPHRLALWLAAGKALAGWSRAATGDDGGIGELAEGLDGIRLAMDGVGVTFLTMLAEANGFCGRYRDGLATVSDALEMMARKGDRYCEPELYRLRGEYMLAEGKASEAIACFRTALQTARAHKAPILAVRAQTCLERVLDAPCTSLTAS